MHRLYSCLKMYALWNNAYSKVVQVEHTLMICVVQILIPCRSKAAARPDLQPAG